VDFDVFGESMTGPRVPEPPKPVKDPAGKPPSFRADWAPVIVDNLVEAKGRTAGTVVRDPVSGVHPVPKKTDPLPPAPAPDPTPVPAPAPVQHAYTQRTRVNSAEDQYKRRLIRRSRGAAFLFNLAFFGVVIGIGGMSAIKDGLPFVGERTIPNLIALGLMTPLHLFTLFGYRWAAFLILAITTLTILAGSAGVWMTQFLELQMGVMLPVNPVMSMASYLTWGVGTFLLLIGLPKDRRFFAGSGFMVLALITVTIAVWGSSSARIANPIIKAPEFVLGDPASGYSFRKLEGWEGFRWNDNVKSQLLPLRSVEPAATEIFLNEPQSLAFFYHTSTDGPGEDEVSVPPSLVKFLTGITGVDRSSEEIKGAIFYTCWGDIPGTPMRPAVYVSTASTEIESGWLHVTMVGHVARLGGEQTARETVTRSLRRILVTFDVDTPPPS